MKEKIKIINVVYEFKDQGGLQRVVANLSNAWDNNGHEIEIWVWSDIKSSFFRLNKNVKIIFFSRNPDCYSSKNKFKKILMFIKQLIKGAIIYRKLIKKNKPDIIFIHRSEIDDPFLGFQHLFKNTYEVLHTPFQINRKKSLTLITKIQRGLFYKFLQPKRNLILVNPEAQNDAIKAGWKNTKYIPNFVPFTSDKKSPCNQKIFLSIGRNTQEKGFPLLIQAFSKVSNNHSDWKLMIIGKGVDEIDNNLHEQVNKFNLADRVELIGQVEDVKNYYLSASVYVLPSYYESSPMVILEAMEYGLPIIVSEIKGLNEFANPECTLSFENGNVDDLSKKMNFIIENDEKRIELAKKAATHVKKFYIANVIPMWDEFLK